MVAVHPEETTPVTALPEETTTVTALPEETSKPGREPNALEKLEEQDQGFNKYCNKANISNLTTLLFFILGLVLELAIVDTTNCVAIGSTDVRPCWSRYVLSFGLFGFAGGITNWLAVTMLFDEIPGVYGSGVIPKQFEQIKITIAGIIMDTFFEPEFLRRQLQSRVEVYQDGAKVTEMVQKMLESDAFDNALDAKIQKLREGSMSGLVFKALGASSNQLKPLLKRFVGSLASEFTAVFIKMFDASVFFDDAAVHKIRSQIEAIIDDRLKELSAAKVKALMEIVIRVHLGWLVVWGNIFGGVIGVICTAAGY